MMLNSKRVVVVVEEEKQEEERMRPRGNKNNNNTTIEEEEEDDDAAKALRYRGVRKRKWGKWVSEIRLPNSRERIWLGSYDSPEKAARAFDAALFCLRGNLANFNFPHQPPDIPGAAHLHPSQIQQVAAHYASSSAASASSSSSSSSSHHDQLHATNPMDVIPSSCTFLVDDHHDNINFSNIPDFGIFPGFDDYFMPLHPTSFTTADDDDHYLAYDSQDPCHLWNF